MCPANDDTFSMSVFPIGVTEYLLINDLIDHCSRFLHECARVFYQQSEDSVRVRDSVCKCVVFWLKNFAKEVISLLLEDWDRNIAYFVVDS